MAIFNQLKWESLDLRSLLKLYAVILRKRSEDLNLGLEELSSVLPGFSIREEPGRGKKTQQSWHLMEAFQSIPGLFAKTMDCFSLKIILP